MRIVYIGLLLLGSTGLLAQRFQQKIFTRIDSLKDISYGEATQLDGKKEALLLDIYQPVGDTATRRPLLLCIHGGGFVNGDKATGFLRAVIREFTPKGYVTSSINYRLGVAKPRTDTAYFEAMYRALHDAKAAIRFFRKNAATYGIDPNQIFVMGGSAGAMTALHVGYLDAYEVPAHIRAQYGQVEGNSGNPGYRSTVQAVINCWGAMVDKNWLATGDAPLFSLHGTADKTVPYDSSYAYHGFKYGSKILHERAQEVGVSTALHLYEQAGHNIGSENVQAALQLLSPWLYEVWGRPLRWYWMGGLWRIIGICCRKKNPLTNKLPLNGFGPKQIVSCKPIRCIPSCTKSKCRPVAISTII